jgi:hypothetical protein
MKQQDNYSPSKANSTTKDLITCIEKKISNNEFQNKNNKNDDQPQRRNIKGSI